MQWAILFITPDRDAGLQKDTNNHTTDLMSERWVHGAVSEMAAVSFTYNSQPQTVNALADNTSLLCRALPETDATQVINDNEAPFC
ncbi:MAG: hypothetical protein IPN22_13710 [Bacteroidetes bacterium]|nr:hypothetical protein [Bacteroidota bacterium]